MGTNTTERGIPKRKRGEREIAERETKMPASATMIGALLGLGTQMYSNALRKLPYMRRKLFIIYLSPMIN